MRHWCVRRRVNISRDISSAVGKPSASIVTLPTQTKAWTVAKVPARPSAKPCCLFSPSFFLYLPFPSPPSPHSPYCLLSFVLSPSSPHFSFLCRLLLLIFSSLPPLCHRSSLRSVVQHVPPRQEGLVSDFCSPEEIWRSNPLSSIFYFFLIYSRVKLKGKKGRGLTAQQESLLSFPRIPLFRTVSHIHQEAQLPRRPHTTQRLHTHSPSLNIWASYTASHMFPLSAPLTFGPSVQ